MSGKGKGKGRAARPIAIPRPPGLPGPPRRKRRKRAAKKRGGKFRGGVHMHFDALTGPPERPLALVGGGATCVRGRTNFTLAVPADLSKVLIFNVGGGGITSVSFTYNATAPAALTTSDLTANAYTPAPDTILPTKGSVGLLDQTKMLDRGGHVKVLNFPQSLLLSSPATVAEQEAVIAFVRGHPGMRIFGNELSVRHVWHQHIVDGVKYQQFEAFRNTVASFLTDLDDPRLSTIIFVFEPYPAARSFEVTVALTAYARYPVIGPLAAMQKPIPSISQHTLNQHNQVMQALGSAAAEVGQEVVAGAGRALGAATQYATGRALARALTYGGAAAIGA